MPSDADHSVYAFDLPERRLQIFKRELKKNRTENLLKRYNYFVDQNEELVAARLSFVPQIYEHYWAVISIADPTAALPSGLTQYSFSIGLFYEYRLPEIMIAHPHGEPRDEMGAMLNDLCCTMRDEGAFAEGSTLCSEVTRGRTITFRAYTESDEDKFPYGYGDFFYRHFMDRNRPTILVAELSADA